MRAELSSPLDTHRLPTMHPRDRKISGVRCDEGESPMLPVSAHAPSAQRTE